MNWKNVFRHTHAPGKSMIYVRIEQAQSQAKVHFQEERFPTYCIKFAGIWYKVIGRDDKHYIVTELTASQREAMEKIPKEVKEE